MLARQRHVPSMMEWSMRTVEQPAAHAKRGRPRKYPGDGTGPPSLDVPTFMQIKALQAAGRNSRQVAEALQLALGLVNRAFGARHYLEFTTGRLARHGAGPHAKNCQSGK